MSLDKVVTSVFDDSFSLREKIAKDLVPIIVKASNLLAETLKDGGKILSCGNGGSACDAQHFACEIANRFMLERDGLPAVSIASDVATMTAIANDYSYDVVFSRQVKALGIKDDVLLAISTSGNSKNILEAISKAHEIGMKVVALTGKDGGKIPAVLNDDDIEIRVSTDSTPRIQEIHILVIHCLCDLIDRIIFADEFEEKS